MKMWISEFQKFIMRGNVVDLAVGVVIGAAFAKIVEAIVGGLFMPIIGVITGGIKFTEYAIPLSGEATLKIGEVVQATISFVIIGFCLFLVVKAMNRLVKKEEVAPVAVPTKTEVLLTEIRDALKGR